MKKFYFNYMVTLISITIFIFRMKYSHFQYKSMKQLKSQMYFTSNQQNPKHYLSFQGT